MTPLRAANPSSLLGTAQQLVFTVESLGDRYRFVDTNGNFVALATRHKHRLRTALAWLGAFPAAGGLVFLSLYVCRLLRVELGTSLLIACLVFLFGLFGLASIAFKAQQAYVFADEAGRELIATTREGSFGVFTFGKFRFHDEADVLRAELVRVSTGVNQQWQVLDSSKNHWLSTGIVTRGPTFTVQQGAVVVAGSMSLGNGRFSLDLRSDPHATVDRRVLLALTAMIHATNQILA